MEGDAALEQDEFVILLFKKFDGYMVFLVLLITEGLLDTLLIWSFPVLKRLDKVFLVFFIWNRVLHNSDEEVLI
jgi:hypothetical protein